MNVNSYNVIDKKLQPASQLDGGPLNFYKKMYTLKSEINS